MGTLSGGETKIGSISMGEMKSYSFDAEVGESVFVMAGDKLDTDFRSFLQIFCPSGNRVAFLRIIRLQQLNIRQSK